MGKIHGIRSMNSKTFKAIARAMEEHNIIRVEMNGVTIVREIPPRPVKQEEAKTFVDPNAPIAKSSPIQHKAEQMSSLLKMGDRELVDSLFPDHREQEG